MEHLVSDHIQQILHGLPHKPGVYQMQNKDGTIIYVGKAKDLSKRVHSYFRKEKNRALKVEKMVAEIVTLKYIEVTSELEALVLETNFIKELRPKYNILMRDDKNYQYIKITQGEDYPRIYTTRKIIRDGALYFGPKTNSSSVYHTLKLLRKLFPYRTCSLDIEDNDGELIIKNKTINIPCMYYHIKRCIGPCIKSCKNEYSEIIRNISAFLSGEYKEIITGLEKNMHTFALEKKFEKAAKSRDLIHSIKVLMEKQLVDQADSAVSQDVIGIEKRREKIFINLFQIRQGKLIAQENFLMEDKEDTSEENAPILIQFLQQYYSGATDIPKEILLPEKLEEKTLMEAWFTTLDKKVRLLSPSRGTKNHLLDLAQTNAISYADQFQIEWQKDHMRGKGAIEALKNVLELDQTLHRIECYDISHLSGTSTVGSMVVFKDGESSKKDYRRFKVKTIAEGEIDDFKSLKEVLSRRLKRIQEVANDTEAPESLYEIPDLIIIDGGKGQLSSVMEIAEKMHCTIPIISLAKQEEEIFLPYTSTPILLPRESEALYLMQNIRDEAHRFAITYNRNLRSKKLVRSLLDDIPGVGPTTKKKLLKHFGSVANLRTTTEEELRPIVGEKLATTIKEYL